MQAVDEVTGPDADDDAANDDYEAAGDTALGKLLRPSAKKLSSDTLQHLFIFLVVLVTVSDNSSPASVLDAVHVPRVHASQHAALPRRSQAWVLQ